MPIHETGVNLVKAKLSYGDYPGQLPLVLTKNKSVTLFLVRNSWLQGWWSQDTVIPHILTNKAAPSS